MKFCTVDAFTHTLFKGNPAAVCVVDAFPDDDFMQQVAMEVGLSNTSFVVPLRDNHFAIRWFTPRVESPISCHGTLATAHVLWSEMEIVKREDIYFESKSGIIKTWRQDNLITMDFPAFYPEPTSTPNGLFEALGVLPVYVSQVGGNYIVEMHTAQEVIDLQPDFTRMLELDVDSLIVTAESEDPSRYDYICRVFLPKFGITEDSVTGIAQCTLATYWSKRLGKKDLRVYQASKRGGGLLVAHEGDRVHLTGEAVTAFSGKFAGVLPQKNNP